MKKEENPKVVVSFMIDKAIFKQFINNCEENNVCINQALVELVIWQNETIQIIKNSKFQGLEFLNEASKYGKSN